MQKLIGGYVTLRSDAFRASDSYNLHTAHVERPVQGRTLESLNHLQKTRWRICVPVLSVIRQMVEAGMDSCGLPRPTDVPLPPRMSDDEFGKLSKEEKRKVAQQNEETHSVNIRLRGQRGALYRRIVLAAELAEHSTLWFPHFLDFRGRAYPIPQDLTPQGDSMAKGLLEFAEGQILDDRGRYWLAVAFANSMGHDKLPLDERAAWTWSQMDNVRRTVFDTLDMVPWWGDADSPWEALQLAFALVADEQGQPVNAPIRLDATCSGIQHLSALMRDTLSARSVNLMDTGSRQDIYMEVARAAIQQISMDAANGVDFAQLWLGKVERKTVKRAVMTTPYGVTPRGISEQLILDGFADHIPNGSIRYKASDYLRDVIVDSLDSNIGAPRTAMKFFQDVAVALSEVDKPLRWTTPADMTVMQAYYETADHKIQTLAGEVWFRKEIPEAGLVRRKQALASAPNVIHSFDAAHLHRTAVGCKAAGIRDLALVHDSFGTHANHIDTMNRVLREEFVAIYAQPQLEIWRQSVIDQSGIKDLPEVPPLGDLDVSCVLGSPFFFS